MVQEEVILGIFGVMVGLMLAPLEAVVWVWARFRNNDD